jgi:tRNA(His) 5'-end guanylyltransferase
MSNPQPAHQSAKIYSLYDYLKKKEHEAHRDRLYRIGYYAYMWQDTELRSMEKAAKESRCYGCGFPFPDQEENWR